MSVPRATQQTVVRRLPWLSLAVWLLLAPIGQLAHQAWEPHYLCGTHGVVEHGEPGHSQPGHDELSHDRPGSNQRLPSTPTDHHDTCDLSLISITGDHPTRVCVAVTVSFLPSVAPLDVPSSSPLSRQPPLSLAPKTSPPSVGIACI